MLHHTKTNHFIFLPIPIICAGLGIIFTTGVRLTEELIDSTISGRSEKMYFMGLSFFIGGLLSLSCLIICYFAMKNLVLTRNKPDGNKK